VVQRLLVWPLFAAIMGFVLGGSTFWGLYGPNTTIEEASTPQHKGGSTAEVKTKKEQIDEALAYYTKWLTIFTGVLAVATLGLGGATMGLYITGEKQANTAKLASLKQFRQTRDSIALTKVSADAAMLSAKAAVAIQLPIIRIKPENLGHTEARIGEREVEECSVDAVILSNLGPTKAFPVEILHGWAIGNELPPEPNYRYVDSFAPNFILEPDPNVTPRKRLTLGMPLERGQWSEILKGNYLWFYCAFRYEDFMGTIHSHGFCWRWTSTGMGMGWRVEDAKNFNRKT
jgi:hypothetical protein